MTRSVILKMDCLARGMTRSEYHRFREAELLKPEDEQEPYLHFGRRGRRRQIRIPKQQPDPPRPRRRNAVYDIANHAYPVRTQAN